MYCSTHGKFSCMCPNTPCTYVCNEIKVEPSVSVVHFNKNLVKQPKSEFLKLSGLKTFRGGHRFDSYMEH